MQSITVRVVTRFRGNEGEDKYSEWVFPDEKSCFLGPEKKPERTFTFDGVSPPQITQEQFYESYAKETIEQFMNGYNGTIFAYGQSGSGKTYTMLGPEDVTECIIHGMDSVSENVQQLYGIIPRTTLTIFQLINEGIKKNIKFSIKCSYLEVYNESINDLLICPSRVGLKIREYPNIGMVVMGLEENYVSTPEDIFKILAIGTGNKMVSATNQNLRSSRSHTVFIINVEQKFFDGSQKVSKLNLVDLAGSEKISKTGATGQTLEEAKKINQSLSCLGLCIMALTSSKKQHVPYRDSKLTLILKESLGGNSKTTLICACSRKSVHEDETVNTLKFAQRAKKIKNRVCSNFKRSNEEAEALILSLKNEIEFLRALLKKNYIKIPALVNGNGNLSDQTTTGTEEDSSQNYYSQYKELETKYKLLEERTDIELEKLKDQIEELNRNPPIQNNLVQEKDDEIERLNKKLNEMIEKYQYSEAEKDDIQTKYEKQIEILNNESNYLKIELETIKNNIYAYQKEVLSLTNEIDLRKKEQKNTSEGYEKLKELYNKLHSKNEESSKKNHDQELANENLKKQIEEKNKKLQEFFKEIDDFNKRVLEMEKESSVLNIILREHTEKEVNLSQQLLTVKNKHKEVLDETALLRKQKDELFKTYQLKMTETQDYVKKIMMKEEESNNIIFELESHLEIYKKAYHEKINMDDEIKSHENLLDQLKDKFMQEISALEKEIDDMQQKYDKENIDLNLEQEKLNEKYNEAKNNIEEEYIKKIQSQENEYRQLKFQILEMEIERTRLLSEKEKHDLKMKEIDLENEKRREEITKLTEEVNNSKMLLIKKEEEVSCLQENQAKLIDDINEKFKNEMIKVEETMNEMRYEKSSFLNKEWDLQVELKKQQKFYELEKENLIKKTQQYEDLAQELRSLKLIHDNLKAKFYDSKSFIIEKNTYSPIRNTYQPQNRPTHNQRKTQLITKPVIFLENLFSKNLFTKNNESEENEKKVEIKITKSPTNQNIELLKEEINGDINAKEENISHQSLSPKSFSQNNDLDWSHLSDAEDEKVDAN